LIEAGDVGMRGRVAAMWRALMARPGLTFLLLYLLSLCACLALGLIHEFRSSPLQLDADEREYYELASQAMQGAIPPSARRTLGFPLLLAGIRSLHDDILFVQIIVCALYALSAPLLFLLVRKIGGSNAAGTVAGAVLGVWPPAVFYGSSLYSETVAAPLFLLVLLALPVGRSSGSTCWRWSMLLSGALLGLLAHVRPMYLLFLPFLATIMWIEHRTLRPALRGFALVLLGFLLPVLPWSIAQTQQFRHPILLTANGGETLAGGLNPNLLQGSLPMTTPSGRKTWAGPGKWIPIHESGYLSREELKLPYDRQDEMLRERASHWAMDNPGEAAWIELRKIGYMWGIYPLAQNGSLQLWFGNLPTMILLALTLWCFVVARGPQAKLVRLWALPLFTVAVALISWGSWRFRQPGDVGLIAFCAIGLVRHVQARRPESRADA